MFGGYIKMSLSPTQQEVVNTPGNMIVRASAGTGKTHTMVSKIAKEIEENHTHKVIAAITFTVKAAKEIRDRLAIDTSEHFIGTNNSFAIEEIIKPFAKDVYGNDYKIEMSTDYSIKEQTYQQCMDQLKKNRIICSYNDNAKNFVFELALNIVKKSRACRLFLKAKYFKIYVDEYQDCDRTMHDFFMYLCNELGIELFVVGDEKQSIYIWRGAYPEAFHSIWTMDNFKKMKLRKNYRSCQMIQNYSNLLYDDTKDLYIKDTNTSSIILLNTTSTKWKQDVITFLNLSKNTALLRFSNANAKKGAEEMSSSGTKFIYVPKTPISEITTNVSWLYNAIAQYFILPKYSEYDFINEIPEESIGNRKIMNYIKSQLGLLKTALEDGDDDSVIDTTTDIASYFGYEIFEDHIRQMIQTIINEEYYPAFHMEELTHVAITFHASKGLEYDQVIVFASDYALNTPESIYNHYVAVTRAKSKLIIVKLDDVNYCAGKQYIQNLSSLFAKSRVELKDIMTIV